MKSKQAFNPFLPSYEYIPDGVPHIFGDRLYLYGSHDKFNGHSAGHSDYICWSAPLNDLADWNYEGIIYYRRQDPNSKGGASHALRTPDVVKGSDGRYYLFYSLGRISRIGVAVSDKPTGPFRFLDYVRYQDGKLLGSTGEPCQTDPSVFADDDGTLYLYTGFAPSAHTKEQHKKHAGSPQGAMVMRLSADMHTLDGQIRYIGATTANSAGTSFEGHEFLCRPSVCKFSGRYYFVYTSVLRHEVCYATASAPDGIFHYGGILISSCDIGREGNELAQNYWGDTYGRLLRLKFGFYVFYNRQTNRHQCSRQACAEPIRFNGTRFLQAEPTSCGLNGGALRGIGLYRARIACVLYSKRGASEYRIRKKRKRYNPYFTQSGKDRTHTPDQYIDNFRHGCVAGFKYFEFDGANQIIVTIKGNPRGKMIISETPTGKPLAKIRLTPCRDMTDFYAPFYQENGKHALYFSYEGTGKFIFKEFRLQQVTRGNKD